MNLGTIDKELRAYTKHVNFNKAVLWMSRQLSLPLSTMDAIKRFQIEDLVFIDDKKNEVWCFKVNEVLAKGERKSVGQEAQWYFPIDLAEKKNI